jgi:predicted transcriptional regulator
MPARETLPALSELEALVMEQVWHEGEATVRQVMEALNAVVGRQRKYTTFMTVMVRLDRKRFLRRRREGNADVYIPTLSREEYRQARAQTEVDQLVRQYGDVALVHFAKQMGRLDRKRQDQLRRLARGA